MSERHKKVIETQLMSLEPFAEPMSHFMQPINELNGIR